MIVEVERTGYIVCRRSDPNEIWTGATGVGPKFYPLPSAKSVCRSLNRSQSLHSDWEIREAKVFLGDVVPY